MDTTSFWISSAPLPAFPAIAQDCEVDVAVVGGGITGITAAWLLKRAGRRVALLERGRCANADTGHTTAHLTAVTDERLHAIASHHGKEAARAVWDAGAAAIDQIAANIRTDDIACDFRWLPGYLHAPLSGADRKATRELEQELEAARELGIDVEAVDAVPVSGLPGLRFPHQALFHPRRYLADLAARIPGDGSHLFENSPAEAIGDEPRGIRSRGHQVRCRDVVLATHTPLSGTSSTLGAMLFQTKLALYTSYAVGAKLPPGAVPHGLYWDLSDPYYYLRVEPRGAFDYAIFGGEDHKTGQETDTPAAYRRLEDALFRLLPQSILDHRWSGQVIETNDGLPFIGATADHQYVATGYAGNGMTFGTLAAMMVTDEILGRANPWRDLFSPGRKKVRGGAWNFLAENKDYPYFLLRDRMARPDTDDLAAVQPGQGRIVQVDGKKVAAYRDDTGALALCSPVCTHLGCIVAWNEAERTWDCPCHGSRFTPSGKVMSGPAESPLEPLPVPEPEKR